MYYSERMMTAIGALSDDKIEKTARALGYQTPGRSRVRTARRMRRLLSAAAAAALILALGVTAYAVYTHWSRGMAQLLPATEEEKELAEQSGLSDASQTVSATANGVTVSVEQTVIDSDTAHIALRFEGFALPEGQYPEIGGWSLTFDGERAPNVTGGFIEERDADGEPLFTAPDGSMEIEFTAKSGARVESFIGREIRMVIDSLGTGDKGRYQPLVEGPWELVWTPSSNSGQLTVQPDAAIGDTGIKLIRAELSPISAKVTLQLPELWEGYQTLEPFNWQLAGVRLRDGTELTGIFGPATSEGYADIDELLFELSYASHQILQPEQVDALLFAARAGSDLIAVPLT